MTGSVAGWHDTSTGRRGYVDDGLEWLLPTGRYQAAVRLSASGPVNVEIWDDTANVLLARQTVPATNGVMWLALPVQAGRAYVARSYSGWGPIRAAFLPPRPGQRLEIRIWSPGHESVDVYSASMTRAG
jgi:hypothetical protein